MHFSLMIKLYFDFIVPLHSKGGKISKGILFSKLEAKIKSNKIIIVVCQNGRILFYSCGQTKTVICNEILLSLYR